MPRVGIDARSLRDGPAGVRTYVGNLLERIPELDPFAPALPGNNLLWNHLRVPLAQWKRRWAAYHASYTAPLWKFCPTVLAAHDISYLVDERFYPYRLGRFRRAYYAASLREADRIVVPTDFSKEEITRVFPDLRRRIRRIHLGVSDFFERDERLAERVRRKLKLPDAFLLQVGDVHPRRRLDETARAAARLEMPLVVVGRVLRGGEAFLDWPLRFEDVSMEELKGIYSAAAVLVYPSLYEGFGLPVLEAMACGLPVVAAARSCLPEVCGDAAVLVQPQCEAIAKGIQQALADSREYVRRGLDRARQFSWDRTARQTRQVYSELAPELSVER